jgi:hypothetical protein
LNNPEEFRVGVGSDKLVALLRDIDRELAQSDGPHVADDQDLLARWENGLLTEEGHAAVLQHLAVCHECSQFIGDMTRAGVMHLNGGVDIDSPSEAQTDSEAVVTLARPVRDTERSLRSTPWYAVTAVACALAVIIGLSVSRSDPESLEVRLADAKFGRLTHYLSQQDFAAIVVPGLAKSGDQSVVQPDETRDQEIQRLTALSQQRPEKSEHQLDLGQLLLEAGRYDEAESQFLTVAQRHPDNMSARLGIGLVQFRRGQIEAAERTFAEISGNGPVSVSARVNQVICLLALDRKPESREIWNKIPPEHRDERIGRVLAVED